MSTLQSAGFSLATQPWIDIVDEAGRPDMMGLRQVLEQADRLYLAAADPLVWSATVRLLTVIAYHARCGPRDHDAYVRQVRNGIDLEPARRWVREHEEDLDLFHPRWPLFQDMTLQHLADRPQARLPVLYLDPAAAISRPLLVDHRPLHASVPVSARRAAHLLLVQQMWATGGKIRSKQAVYGTGAALGRAAAATGSVVWQPAGTVAEQLTWRLMAVPGVLGRASFTHTPSAGTEEFPVGSELDGLSWQPRRMLLLPEADGTVREVLLTQGWRMKHPELKASSVATLPGNRDLVDVKEGQKFSSQQLTSDQDQAPLLERWWGAPEGSWAHAVRQAAARAGRTPDVVAVGLAVRDHSVIVHQRRITLPADLLADTRSAAAAHTVMHFRRQARTVAPDRLAGRSVGTVLPPGFGSGLLDDPQFLDAEPDEQAALLFAAACSATGVHGRRRTLLAGAVSHLIVDGSEAAPEEPPPTEHATASSSQMQLFSLEPDVPGSPVGEGARAAMDTHDDSFLFVTAASTTAAPPTRSRRRGDHPRVSDGETGELAFTLTRQLGRWDAHPRTRYVLVQLATWVVRPSPDTQAYRLVTRLMPDHLQHAALLTAGLFAMHRRTNSRAQRYGGAPLARLMRAFGSDGSPLRGPADLPTRAAALNLLRVPDAHALRVPLARIIRKAAQQDLTPHWGQLFTDLAEWGPDIRQKWADQFYTARPASSLPATMPANLPQDSAAS
ncbi:type I-E CRISPR-associated protein Cse1/CasA [Streptomyces sp. NBC_01390]|uniref:type I-E CRISPR-associated protein Cse1/CasA n=1 Tax=Streptomyces sp. NBC_01390 TaxID=2903850 RepID=UPI00324E5770